MWKDVEGSIAHMQSQTHSVLYPGHNPNPNLYLFLVHIYRSPFFPLQATWMSSEAHSINPLHVSVFSFNHLSTVIIYVKRLSREPQYAIWLAENT